IRLAAAPHWPIVETLIPETLLSQGIGQLLITRRLPDGRLAVANLLVDVYCLGVKNAYWNIISEWEYDKLKRKVSELGTLHPVTPEYFAKLIYGAVEFAHAIGIAPHPDYGHARLLLAGIDPSLCADEFTFGKEGKPFYINGPYDSAEKIQVIMHKVKLAGGEISLRIDRDGKLLKTLNMEIVD